MSIEPIAFFGLAVVLLASALAVVLTRNLFHSVLYLALMPLLFPFKILDVILSRHRHAGKIGALYYFHGLRPGPEDGRP